MNVKRIWILVKTEVRHGPKDVILVMAVILPLLLAFFANLAIGNIFGQKAEVGIFDEGESQVVEQLKQNPALVVETFTTERQLKDAAARGAVDVGFILPADFDRRIFDGSVDMQAYVWGESSAQNRTVIPVILAGTIRQLRGEEIPVKIEPIEAGQSETPPWSSRLLPLTILMAVFFGGLMIPASSLINEKIRHTLEALNVTPVNISEIFAAKGIIGLILASLMGVATLLISGNFSSSPAAMVLLLLLGAALATELGLLAGALIKDVNTLYSVWKFGGLLLFGPATIYLFPQIPQWIGYFFPTFYVIKPIVDISLNGADFGGIAIYAAVLAVMVGVLLYLINKLIRRLSTRALRV